MAYSITASCSVAVPPGFISVAYLGFLQFTGATGVASDGWIGSTYSGNTPTPGSLTTTANGDVIFPVEFATTANQGVVTHGAGMTLENGASTTNNPSYTDEFQIQTSAAAINIGFSNATSTAGLCAQGALKKTGGAFSLVQKGLGSAIAGAFSLTSVTTTVSTPPSNGDCIILGLSITGFSFNPPYNGVYSVADNHGNMFTEMKVGGLIDNFTLLTHFYLPSFSSLNAWPTALAWGQGF